jgi:hypothetical protein
MSWQLAAKVVYKSLINEAEYPIRCLNRFKTDPRVRTGPRFDSREKLAVLSFGAELQASRRHFFVLYVRSRFYAIEAKSVREARRIVEQYAPIREPSNSTRRKPAGGVAGSAAIRPIQAAPGEDSNERFGVDSDRRLEGYRRSLEADALKLEETLSELRRRFSAGHVLVRSSTVRTQSERLGLDLARRRFLGVLKNRVLQGQLVAARPTRS